MSGIQKAAFHPTIWGKGFIISDPAWSTMVGGYVVLFQPDSKDFSLLVPVDEFETE